MKAKHLALLAAAGMGAWSVMYRLGRSWGSTAEERHRYLPGDDLVEDAQLVTNHATTIKASAEDIWPWLVQMGWHRAGWYTYRWVDRLLFPGNNPSADHILAEWQDLQVGDCIPDGSPETGCFFQVEALEPSKYLVLRSWTHLPPTLRKDPRNRMEWTWGFYLEETHESATRFIFRVRGNLHPGWLRLAYHLLVVPADFIMGRSMCLGLRRRAEGGDSRHRHMLGPVRRLETGTSRWLKPHRAPDRRAPQ
jgi:hypothetical protein